ncbi:hypothetical protein SMICM304S_05087 [Streptomyces microflavus]
MSSSEQRRRQLAREKFERQQKRREEARLRTRRITAIVAASVAVVAVVGVSAFVVAGKDDGKDGKKNDAAASQSPEPTPSESESKAPAPPMTIDKKASYTMSLGTSQGDIAFTMDAAKTPQTANSFKALADKGYFDGTKCHRLTTQGIFVLQCGDPKGDGTGGPGYNIPDENLTALGKAGADGAVTFPAGTVAMAQHRPAGHRRQPVLPGLQGHEAAPHLHPVRQARQGLPEGCGEGRRRGCRGRRGRRCAEAAPWRSRRRP